MKTYLIPVTESFGYDYCYIACVHANSSEEAYQIAKEIYLIKYYDKIVDNDESHYEIYDDELPIQKSLFYISEKNGIIQKALSELYTEGYEMETVDIYDYMYWGDYNAQIQKLAEKALPEKWNFDDKDDNCILKNYIKYTFKKLQDENKIIETDNCCVFNTGLFSKYYEPIYAYGEINKNTTDNAAKWYFKGFKDEYELGLMDIESGFPERADYFSEPNRLVFNWHYKINVNYRHILNDLNTSQRLPDSIKNADRPLDVLKGVIDTAIQKVTANYKLAVPHYYQNKIQLLIPLCFGKDDTPNVALVLNLMKNGYYQAATCLSMEMAYMDARLIAKPESNWLIADNITED